MPNFASYDTTPLAYRERGRGEPLLCLPGGPGRPAAYLGTLGGLDEAHKLFLLDQRGTGESGVPADPASYRIDRLVADVEAFREHLGLATIDLLAHSASGGLALVYAARHPERLRRLVLVTPGLRPVGMDQTDDELWYAEVAKRRHEPWYDDALVALKAWDGGDDGLAVRLAAQPFFYSPWDERAQRHAHTFTERSAVFQENFMAPGVPGPEEVRTALARLQAPTLVIAGADDPEPTPDQTAALAALLPHGESVTLPGAHYPWVTAPEQFRTAVTEFLSR